MENDTIWDALKVYFTVSLMLEIPELTLTHPFMHILSENNPLPAKEVNR
jgi:hypothetical protein